MTDNIVTFKPKPKPNSPEPTETEAGPIISILITDDGKIDMAVYSDVDGNTHEYVDFLGSCMIAAMAMFHNISMQMHGAAIDEIPVSPQED